MRFCREEGGDGAGEAFSSLVPVVRMLRKMMILARTDPSHPTGLLCISFLSQDMWVYLTHCQPHKLPDRPEAWSVCVQCVIQASFGELKFTMSFQNLTRVMEALGPDYKFHGAEAAKVRASECVCFLLGQVCKRTVTRPLSALEIFLRGNLVLLLLKWFLLNCLTKGVKTEFQRFYPSLT